MKFMKLTPELQGHLDTYTKVEFTTQEEFENRLVAARDELLTAGATALDLRRAGLYLANEALANTALPHRVRAAMLAHLERVFGGALPVLRARVAGDEAGWRAMKEAGGLADTEIEEYLIRGQQGAERVLGWRMWAWLVLCVLAWQYSRTVAAVIFVAPLVLFVSKAFVRARSKRPKVAP
jgi:hypothetical protein